jgi:2-C-methyl-D-erythritol 4-phosphate cytidylyltransferase
MNWWVPLPRDVAAVIVAAGQGSRFGGSVPKQFLSLGGQPVLLHAIRPFTSHPEVAGVIVVLPEADASDPPGWLASIAGESLRIVAGGATRKESVANGIAALGDDIAIALVHDGARPFPPREAIDGGIAAARDGHGAVPALPVSDTIKRADQFGRVLTTVPREGLWRAQTPQAFPLPLLRRAHQCALPDGVAATDDAMLVELAGGCVDLLPGDPRNLKITTALDLELAEWLLQRR